jgi:hypothetical protein
MWVERVSARAFGPFRDAVLTLGPGLTVVAGPNEAGKSSWHAALRLALTGRRRGRGVRAEDRETEEQYRPWDDSEGPWEVEARLHLDDGRVIEINQDLAGRVDCRAMDVGLGRDVSAEIIVDGSPDASRWLGLERQAFAATLAVDQARILAVVDAADGLQDDMQRAAATAGRDATAAEAITRLNDFRKTAVGAATRVAVGPLRRAQQAAEDAGQILADARARHAEHLALAAAAEAAEDHLITVRDRVRDAEAVVEQSRIGALLARVRRAAELSSRHPQAPAPLEATHSDTAAVAAALDAWRRKPPTPVLADGPDSAELARQLAALPPPPVGDVAPHPAVLDAMRALDQAEGAAAELGEAAGPQPRADRGRILLGAGLAAAAVGAVLIVLNLPAAGVVLVALGLGLVVFGAARMRGGAGPGQNWNQRRAEADGRVRVASDVAREALRQRGAPTNGDGDVHAAISAYTAACADRATVAAEAAAAESLRLRLDARRQQEADVAAAVVAAVRAADDLRAAAGRVGLSADGSDPDAIVSDLEAWQQRRAAELRAGEGAIAEWQELTDLLEGRSLAEWQSEADAAVARLAAAGLSATVELPAGTDAAAVTAAAEASLAARQEDLMGVEREAASLAGEARQQATGLPPVAEAEEAVASAAAELDRVEALVGVLDDALGLLRRAEEQVHRDLAPILADAVRRYLPRVSDARYVDVTVDPRDLRVQVKEAASGQWRDARRLSEGTREQVYLLLRVAMAQHLVTTDETAPLLLDEVTAQADDERREALLGVLHELSRERQIVLFTHDRRVAAWAESRRDPERDVVVTLGGIAASVA